MNYSADVPVITADKLQDLTTLRQLLNDIQNVKLFPLFEKQFNDLKAEYNCDVLAISGGIEELPIGALSHFSKIKEIILPKSLKSISGAAFLGCSSLERIVIPDSVTEISHRAFQGCKSLKEIVLPSSLETIGQKAFYECFALESITIPETIKEISFEAFAGCLSLKEINFPNKIFTLDGTFANGTQWFKDFPGDFVIAADSIFIQYKGSEKEVTVPDGIKVIGDCAFEENFSVRKIHLPDTVEKIGTGAFYWCPNLEEINIPPLVTAIEDSTFYKCRSLKRIELPPSVTKVGFRAFRGCRELEDVIGAEHLKDIGKCAFTYSPFAEKHPEYELPL